MRMHPALWKNRRLYSRLLASITLCIVLTLLVSTLVYYFYYIDIEKKQAFRSDLSNLMQTSKEVADMTETAESLSFQIYRNSTVSTLLYYAKPNVYDLTAAMSELSNYVNSMPYLESIYVYNPNSGDMYVAASRGQNGLIPKEELADRDIMTVLKNYKDYKPFTPIPRTYAIEAAHETKRISAYTYLCYDAIGWSSEINSAVIVNVSATWINKNIAAGTVGASYILDDRGHLLSGGTMNIESTDEAQNRLIDDRIRGREAGYAVAKWKGRSALISYTASDNLGWQYIRVTPYESVSTQTVAIRNNTLLLAAAILLLGLVVSWVLSRKLYTPIGQIVSHVNALENDKRNDSFAIRQNTLRNLVTGVMPLRSDTQKKLLSQGITFHFHQSFRLVHIRMDEYNGLKTARGKDLLPYKFAIMNIASEVAGSRSYRTETVDIEEDAILLLLGLPDGDTENEMELLCSTLAQIRDACRDYLRLCVTATFSPVRGQPEELHPLYQRVLEASRRRFFTGHGSVIDAEAAVPLPAHAYAYPSETERKLSDALMSGKLEEARQLFSEIVQGTQAYEHQVLRLTLSRMTVTAKSILDHVRKRNGLPTDEGPILPSLEAFETAGELEEAVFHLFGDLQAKLTERRGSKQEELVRRVNGIISDHYADPNLSLNRIADELGMSPVYISRLYKQLTMRAIVDVILECRMAKACELLEGTDDSVSAVAEQTGFTSSSYFHRMFKRSFGVTPADFRRTKLLKGS